VVAAPVSAAILWLKFVRIGGGKWMHSNGFQTQSYDSFQSPVCIINVTIRINSTFTFRSLSVILRSTTVTIVSIARPRTQTQTHPVRSTYNRKLVWYYAALLLATVGGLLYGFFFSEVFFPSSENDGFLTVMNLLKLSWLIPLPYALLNFYSFFRYPALRREPAPPVSGTLRGRLYFRYVTRGNHPKLIAETVARACDELSAALPPDSWALEVVVDSPLELDEAYCAQVIVVPPGYQPPGGARYKARALQYALGASTAQPHDWIIHLDEETRFTGDTVRAIRAFAQAEEQRLAAGGARFARIGQGIILYAKSGVVNWVNTLADSIRVGDDYGRFRLQYEQGKAWFGMHGSFVMVQDAVERMIGFDHGPAGNITEDAYFALAAQAAGVEFGFIHAFMLERSPFNLVDFAKQRRRWFGGLWACVFAPALPLADRALLGTFMTLWALSPLCILLVYTNLLMPTGTPVWLAMIGGISFFYFVSLYVVGFLQSYDRGMGGWRYAGLLAAQLLLIPVFSVMESAGVIYGLLSPVTDFHIVQKEA
jgi:egghead protein (zeste-white 4 protein)